MINFNADDNLETGALTHYALTDAIRKIKQIGWQQKYDDAIKLPIIDITPKRLNDRNNTNIKPTQSNRTRIKS